MELTLISVDGSVVEQDVPTPLHVRDFDKIAIIIVTENDLITDMAVNPAWLPNTEEHTDLRIDGGALRSWTNDRYNVEVAFDILVAAHKFRLVTCAHKNITELVNAGVFPIVDSNEDEV